MITSLLLTALSLVEASPYAAPQPVTTPSPVQYAPSKTRRDLTGDIASVLGSLGSNIPSYVADGVANFFQDLPVGDAVQDALDIDDEQLAALPPKVLNIP